MKRNSTFKLKKSTKTLMSRISNDVLRHHFKNMMIEAQIASEIKPAKKD